MRNHKGKNTIALLLAGMLTLMSPMTAGALTYRDVQGALPGNPLISESRELARGITYDTWKGLNDGGRAVVFNTFTLDTANPEAGAMAWSGSALTERNTLSGFIADARSQGLNVVGGVNGDFFNLASGTPLGILVRNGVVQSSEGSNYFAVGFRADGSAVMGNPSIQYQLYRNSQLQNEFHLNKDEGDFGPYVYTALYGPRAGSDELGVDVVVNMPDIRLVIGGAIEGVVAEVRLDAQGTPVGLNQVVLSARTGKNGYMNLAQMVAGDVIRLEARDLDGQWTGVTEAIGGLHRLLENGVPVPGLSATNINPATLIGKKPDGRVVMLEVDGRQPAWSNGISYQEGARLMMQMGCTDAIVCDGGGSSTAAVRLPGTLDPLLVNRPSDGSERKVSNALLLISKTPASAMPDPVSRLLPAGMAVQLHLYPGKSYLLPGSSANWQAKATDAGYHAAEVPAGMVWTTDGGTFSPDGTLTAGGAPGLYTVTASAGAATGQATFIIPETLTEIRVSRSSLIVAAGETVDLNASGYIEGIDVRGVDTSFSWTVDPAVGTVTAEGVFTAADAPEATGSVFVSWNGVGTQVPVYISRNPLDFSYAYINGYSSGKVGFNDPLTREQICAALYRIYKQSGKTTGYLKPTISDFTDLATNKWSYAAIEYMVSVGAISKGATVNPTGPVTRGEIAKIIAISDNMTDNQVVLTFSDLPNTHQYFKYMNMVVNYGLIRGYGNNLIKPNGLITRAEFVTMINRFIGRDNRYNVSGLPSLYSDLLPSHWAFAEIQRASFGFTAIVDDSGYFQVDVNQIISKAELDN